MDNSVNLIVKSRESVVFQGEAASISGVNKKGKFDILPLHANFISLIETTLVVHNKDGTTQDINVDNGIVRARENKIEVYLGIKR